LGKALLSPDRIERKWALKMDVRGDKLIGGFPVFCDGSDVLSTNFVVQDLMIDSVTTGLEMRHDAGVGWKVMTVVSGLKGFHKDGIGVAVVC
jgi:hypothetical protein